MSGPGRTGGFAALDGTATDHHTRGVLRMSAEMVNSSLVLIAGIVVVSMVFAAVDLLRQPTWAWRAAGEPKIICLLMVLLLPGVGLAIYVFGARPKVVEIAANGRAASLPFERFGDRAESAVESNRAIQALARPMTRGSFGEPITRTIRDSTPVGASFFDDPDVLPVGAAPGFVEAGGMPSLPVAVETVTDPTPESTIRIPGQTGKSYNPRQRTSLDEGPLRGPSLATVAADLAGGGRGGGGGSAATHPVPQPVGAGAGVGAMGAGLPAMPPPRIGTSSPEIFRPRPETVAPIADSAPLATAPMATMAARWMNDPTGRHQYRYWDGGRWTENVYDAGVESRDSVSS